MLNLLADVIVTVIALLWIVPAAVQAVTGMHELREDFGLKEVVPCAFLNFLLTTYTWWFVTGLPRIKHCPSYADWVRRKES